jgi:hypothetical protein
VPASRIDSPSFLSLCGNVLERERERVERESRERRERVRARETSLQLLLRGFGAGF